MILARIVLQDVKKIFLSWFISTFITMKFHNHSHVGVLKFEAKTCIYCKVTCIHDNSNNVLLGSARFLITSKDLRSASISTLIRIFKSNKGNMFYDYVITL